MSSFDEIAELIDKVRDLHLQIKEDHDTAIKMQKRSADEYQKICNEATTRLDQVLVKIGRCTRIVNTHYLSVAFAFLMLGICIMFLVNYSLNNDAISRELDAIRDQDYASKLQAKYSKYEKYEPLLAVLHEIDEKDKTAITLESKQNFIKGTLKDSTEDVIRLSIKKEYSTQCHQPDTKCYTDKKDPEYLAFYGTGATNKYVHITLKK